jgi:23S rRNA (cytosine1962-C5)-methyltransferase
LLGSAFLFCSDRKNCGGGGVSAFHISSSISLQTSTTPQRAQQEQCHRSFAFIPRSSSSSSSSSSSNLNNDITRLFSTASDNKQDDKKNIKKQSISSNDNKKKNKQTRSPKYTTLEGLTQQVLQNTAKYLPPQGADANKKKKKKSNRTRKRVENPQQTYIYAAQKKKLQGGDAASTAASSTSTQQQSSSAEQTLARELGLMPAAQHTDALYGEVPVVMGRVRVLSGKNSSPNLYAYIIDKPAGWCILGSKQRNDDDASSSSTTSSTEAADDDYDDDADDDFDDDDEPATSNRKDGATTRKGAPAQMIKNRQQQQHVKKVIVKDKRTGEIEDVVEYNEVDVFNMMTAEEIEEFLEDGGELPVGFQFQRRRSEESLAEFPFAPFDNEDDDDESHQDDMSGDDLVVSKSSASNAGNSETSSSLSSTTTTTTTMSAATKERLRRITARQEQSSATAAARFSSNAPTRPSLISWLQDEFQTKGGTYWKAMAGATAVDDSGLVLLCPKTATDQVYFDSIDFVAVMGDGDRGGDGGLRHHDSRKTLVDGTDMDNTAAEERTKLLRSTDPSQIRFQTLAKLRKGRGDDVVHTVRARTSERPVSCDDIVKACQKEYPGDCIRGDPVSHPLDRRARRRLIHCQQMSVSSLLLENNDSNDNEDEQDSTCQVETKATPDDIAVFSDRQGRGQQSSLFRKGSFLGRSVLRNNQATTNAYREINGAADGHPGWIVDRYDKWLLVQHDPEAYAADSSSSEPSRGPLPSIHDGHTVGVYYMKSIKNQRPEPPVLLEGQQAPDLFPVYENGIQYLVSFKDLSTGIFLDQRPQRAWLAKNCCNQTRVLNCFAHTGAFSVAAATAGASTVSLDLSQRWLDRLPQNLQTNGIKFDERHDAIYGDCFDWLVRFAKRGETFDLVILDPPSTSVGGLKKKRWSIKNDMAELVALALPLVKKGGLLWTTTNSATLSSVKFARLCSNGFDDDAADDSATKDTDTSLVMKRNKSKKTIARLERIQPMPSDFPTIGPQQVKNLVWRVL